MGRPRNVPADYEVATVVDTVAPIVEQFSRIGVSWFPDRRVVVNERLKVEVFRSRAQCE